MPCVILIAVCHVDGCVGVYVCVPRYSGTDAALMIPLRDVASGDATLDGALASAKEAFSLRYRTEFGFDLPDRYAGLCALSADSQLKIECS